MMLHILRGFLTVFCLLLRACGVKGEYLMILEILHVIRNVATATQSKTDKRHPCQRRLPKVLQRSQEYEL